MATILLVGVDLFLRGRFDPLLAEHRVLVIAGDDRPDLVIADIGRVEPLEVVAAFPNVTLLGFTNHTNTAALRAAHEAGFDRVVVKSALFDRPGELIGALLAEVESAS